MNSAIVVAGGKGSRMKAQLPKQFLKLDDYTILHHTLDTFVQNEYIDEIVVVIHQDYLESEYLKKALPETSNKDIKVVAGGSSRQESVYNGFQELHPEAEIILVHDGVRPFVSDKTINQNIQRCKDEQAILTAYPATDTLKLVQQDIVQDTLDRDKVWKAQTPQTFQKDLLKQAFDRAHSQNITATDEASLVEKIADVHILKGSKNNIKITHPEDLVIAKSILEEA